MTDVRRAHLAATHMDGMSHPAASQRRPPRTAPVTLTYPPTVQYSDTLSSSDADARRANAPAVEPLLLHMRRALLSGRATACLSASSGDDM